MKTFYEVTFQTIDPTLLYFAGSVSFVLCAIAVVVIFMKTKGRR